MDGKASVEMSVSCTTIGGVQKEMAWARLKTMVVKHKNRVLMSDKVIPLTSPSEPLQIITFVGKLITQFCAIK